MNVSFTRTYLVLLLLFPAGLFAGGGRDSLPTVIPSPIQYNGATYKLQWDRWMSGRAAGEGLITFHRAWEGMEESYIPSRVRDESRPLNKAAGVALRSLKLATLDFLVDYLVTVGTHEFLGHGFRYREFGFRGNSFNVALPPPLGPWGGFASLGIRDTSASLGRSEAISSRLAGSEGSRQIANALRDKWVTNDSMSARQAMLYLMSFHDMTAYIYTTQNTWNPSGDIAGYIIGLDPSISNPTEFGVVQQHINRRNAFNLANTWSLLSLYTLVRHYIWEGTPRMKVPRIRFGKSSWNSLGWLPSVRMGLTPFGTEIFGEHHIWFRRRPFLVYHRHGDPRFNRFGGFGVKVPQVLERRRLRLGLSAEAWNQPDLTLTRGVVEGGWGGAVKADLGLGLTPFFFLQGEVGYKTTGYLEGEILDQGWIVRLGLGFRMRRDFSYQRRYLNEI